MCSIFNRSVRDNVVASVIAAVIIGIWATVTDKWAMLWSFFWSDKSIKGVYLVIFGVSLIALPVAACVFTIRQMRKKPPKREYALRVNDTAWTVDDRLMAVGDAHFDFVQHRVWMSVPFCLKCSSALFKNAKQTRSGDIHDVPNPCPKCETRHGFRDGTYLGDASKIAFLEAKRLHRLGNLR